jgi:hypothetical protein
MVGDPAFPTSGGFPVGDDEAILVHSDPPYYSACPNPFLPEIIAGWRMERRPSAGCTNGVAPL